MRHGGQTPCYVTADPVAETAAYRAFMTPDARRGRPRPGGTAPRAGRAGGARPGGGVPAGLVADTADGRAQARALAGTGIPVYFPKLILAGSRYCSSLTGNCDTPGEPVTDFATSYPRRYHIFVGGTRTPPTG